MKKYNKIFIFIMLMAILATCFVGCAPSDKKLIEKFNTAVTADNAIDTTLGDYTLPTVSAELSKDGVTFDIAVKDSVGQNVEVKDGKFAVKMGGEYEITVIAKNKAGKVVAEKSYRVTENSILTAKLTDDEKAAFIARKNNIFKEAFAIFGVDYAKYSQLSQADKSSFSGTIEVIMLLESMLNDTLLASGLSVDTLNRVLDGVKSYIDINASEEPLEDSVAIDAVKAMYDKVLTPMINGAESPIAIANFMYEIMLNNAKTSTIDTQEDYNIAKRKFDTATAVKEMTDAQIETFVKGIKTSVDSKISELVKINNLSFAPEVYKALVSYKVVPTLTAEQLNSLFMSASLSTLVLNLRTDEETLFKLFVGAELFAKPEYTNFSLKDERSSLISDAVMSVQSNGALPLGLDYDVSRIIKGLTEDGILYFGSLFEATDDLTNNISTFKETIKFYAPTQETVAEKLFLSDTAKAMLEDMIANKASEMEAYTIMSKVSEVLAPVINSSLVKEIIIMQACGRIFAVEYIPSFINPDTAAININPADIVAILTSVGGELDKFITKYDALIDGFDKMMVDMISESFVSSLNADMPEDGQIDVNSVKSIATKYFKITKPLFASIKSVLTMVSDTNAIDYFIKSFPLIDTPDEDPNTLGFIAFGQFTLMSKTIITFVDTLRGDMTFDAYLAAIKADIIADAKLSTVLDIEKIDAMFANVKMFYTLAEDTLKVAGGKIMIALPEDTAELERVIGIWSEILESSQNQINSDQM